MSQKNKKQFGIWMDTHQAIVVGRANPESDDFSVLGVAGDAATENLTDGRNDHQDPKTHQHKFFKEILLLMQNADEVHITGTGTTQEQMMKYMAGIPQFKNTVTNESTSNKMSEENLVAFITTKFDSSAADRNNNNNNQN